MPQLHLALEEGYARERAVVRVDDQVILDQPDVETLTQIGCAALCEAAVEPGDHTVQVSLPGRGLERTVRVTIRRDTFMAFSVTERGIEEPRISEDPFFYA